jgi:hypothetical protein
VSEPAWESFVHVKTHSLAETHIAVSDQALALLLYSGNDYTVRVYREPDGKLLWQKSLGNVNTNISPFQIVGQWLCLYGSQGTGPWRTFIFDLETGKDLYAVIGAKVWSQALQGQGLNEPIVASHGNRVVVARMANFAVFELKERRWFKPEVTQNLSFLTVIDQYVFALDSRRKPVLFSLVDGSVRSIDLPLSTKELESLRADLYSNYIGPIYHWKSGSLVLLPCSDFRNSKSFLLLTEKGKGYVFTTDSLGLKAHERWRILFQKTLEIKREPVLVVVLRPDTPSIGDCAVFLTLDSSGHVLSRREVEFSDIHHVDVYQNNLLLAYSDYAGSRVVFTIFPRSTSLGKKIVDLFGKLSERLPRRRKESSSRSATMQNQERVYVESSRLKRKMATSLRTIRLETPQISPSTVVERILRLCSSPSDQSIRTMSRSCASR